MPRYTPALLVVYGHAGDRRHSYHAASQPLIFHYRHQSPAAAETTRGYRSPRRARTTEFHGRWRRRRHATTRLPARFEVTVNKRSSRLKYRI